MEDQNSGGLIMIMMMIIAPLKIKMNGLKLSTLTHTKHSREHVGTGNTENLTVILDAFIKSRPYLHACDLERIDHLLLICTPLTLTNKMAAKQCLWQVMNNCLFARH